MRPAKSAGVLFLLLAVFLCAEVPQTGQGKTEGWARNLLPLPHEFSVEKEVILKPADISLKLRDGAGDAEKTGFSEMENLFREKAGLVPAGGQFFIIVGVMDDKGKVDGRMVEKAADRLKNVPNNQQSYVIQPQGANTLIVTGLHERGVYYGIRTLYQLLEFTITPEKATIPLASVVDWPDFDERGVWNFMTDEFLPWYASYKLNFSHISAGLEPKPVRRDEKIRIRNISSYMRNRRIRAFVPEFSITHLNFVDRYYGLYEAYPELAGKGESAWQKANPHPLHRVPCASNPLLAKVLTEIMESAAGQGVRDFSVWLSEFTSQCECEDCRKTGQSEAETYASISAWKKVRAQYPDGLYLGGGILEWFPSRQSFDEKIEVFNRALALTEQMQQPAITAATAYGLGHLKTLKAIYQILEPLYAGDIIVKGNRGIDAQEKTKQERQYSFSSAGILIRILSCRVRRNGNASRS